MNKKSGSQLKNVSKTYLKCGFVITGRPKKVWAVNIPCVTLQIDVLDITWLQIGRNMLLTTYDKLSKYRSRVQCAMEFGLAKLSIPELNEVNISNSWGKTKMKSKVKKIYISVPITTRNRKPRLHLLCW